MEETPAMKTCHQCAATKPLTPEFYGVQTASADGFRAICRVCFSDNRSAEKMRGVKNLKNHDRIVKAAKKALEKPELLPPNQLHKMNQIVNGDEKKRAKLQAKIQETHAAEEAAKFAQTANPALARMQAQFGSALFIPAAEHEAVLEKLKVTLATLTGPADGLARDYVESNIALLTKMLANAAASAAEKAEYEQKVTDGSACQNAADAIHDKFAGLFGEGVSTVEREKLKALFQIVREQAQQQHKTIKSDEVTATGANRKKISSRILEELTKIASRLGKAGMEVGAHQSLENAQSLDWSQQTSARDMRAYVRELTVRLEAARATMTPEEYKKKYLELPVAPKEEIIVWRVRLLDGREEWMWPSGKVVRRGVDIGSAEVVKDALHGWVIAPSPVGAELDDETKPAAKMELIQDPMDCTEDGAPKWKWVPEGSAGVWEQQTDGSFKRTDNPSPWSAPEKVVFKVGPAQPDALHSEFRLGNWFTEAETIKAEHGPDLETPPVLLPPLKRGKADSIAVEPPMTAEEIAKENREPSRWRRHEARMKQEKEAEQASLRGTYIWDKSQALTGDSHGNG